VWLCAAQSTTEITVSPKVIRRTKIVATVGPASESDDIIAKLIGAGVNVFRLNFSHGTAQQHARVAAKIRKQAAIAGQYVGIMADLQGPKIRIGSFRDDFVELANGDRFRLDLNLGEDEGDIRGVGLEYEELCSSVVRGDILLLDDGRIRMRVDDVEPSAVECSVLVGGKLSSRKGINRLGGGLAAPALTAKDLTDIDSLAEVGPDFVAVSFVSRAEDIFQTRELLQQHQLQPDIIAKIERAEVVADDDTLNGILKASDGVMVARGDLGVEVGDAQLIGIQKELITRARNMDRVVITATQMMESMINSSMPTRAEVFDVANSVLDGTDAVMLSAETAVAIYAANHFDNVRGIACLTESGNTPRLMSRLSSGLPIFALSHLSETLQKLSLCRGVVPLYFDAAAFDHDRVDACAIEFLMDGGYLRKGDSIILTKGEIMGTAGSTNIMKILPVA
jgi:pyruvate kinase